MARHVLTKKGQVKMCVASLSLTQSPDGFHSNYTLGPLHFCDFQNVYNFHSFLFLSPISKQGFDDQNLSSLV